MKLEPERLVAALLSNLDSWIEAVEEIHDNATVGNKRRAIHLQRNMLQARQALIRLSGEGNE